MSETARVIEHPAIERSETARPANDAHAAAMLKRRKRLLIGFGASLAVLALAGGTYWYVVASHYVSTDNAYVGASVAQINSQVAGPVAEVRVEDTQMVRKGDVLAVIDASDARLAVARAEADYQHTLQRVGQYYAQRAVA